MYLVSIPFLQVFNAGPRNLPIGNQESSESHQECNWTEGARQEVKSNVIISHVKCWRRWSATLTQWPMLCVRFLNMFSPSRLTSSARSLRRRRRACPRSAQAVHCPYIFGVTLLWYQEASSSKPFLGSMYNEVIPPPKNLKKLTFLKIQLQYLKRLQYTAKNMTGLNKVAKEANKGLKFLDTRYI